MAINPQLLQASQLAEQLAGLQGRTPIGGQAAGQALFGAVPQALGAGPPQFGPSFVSGPGGTTAVPPFGGGGGPAATPQAAAAGRNLPVLAGQAGGLPPQQPAAAGGRSLPQGRLGRALGTSRGLGRIGRFGGPALVGTAGGMVLPPALRALGVPEEQASLAGQALQGAGIGAGVGSLIAPGVGTAIGAGLGAAGGTLLGLFGGEKGEKVPTPQEAQAAVSAQIAQVQNQVDPSVSQPILQQYNVQTALARQGRVLDFDDEGNPTGFTFKDNPSDDDISRTIALLGQQTVEQLIGGVGAQAQGGFSPQDLMAFQGQLAEFFEPIAARAQTPEIADAIRAQGQTIPLAYQLALARQAEAQIPRQQEAAGMAQLEQLLAGQAAG